MAFVALEAGLVFSVLYGLAVLNLPLASGGGRADLPTSVLLTGALFVTILLVTQSTTIGAQASVAREIAIFSVISFVFGCLMAVALWVHSLNLTWLPTLLCFEGAVAVPTAIALWRWFSVRYDVLDVDRERILIVGTGETSQQICRVISSQHASHYAIVGFADETAERQGALLAMGVRIQTDYASIPEFVDQRLDRIIVALDEKRGKLPIRELMEVRLRGIEVEDATSFLERATGKLSVETMLPSWLIFSNGFKSTPIRRFLKRTVDIVHSVALLILASPAMLLAAIAIKLDSQGPVLYRQTRLGRYGREFNVLKFRSMRADAEKASGPSWAQVDDPRVTRVGRVIRKLRIDELPQLINVLRGEMSFVGPRPERGHFVRQLEERIPYYGIRMTVRPGITGWAQVEYGYGASEDDALEKLKYDLFYIKNESVLFDLWIILKTFKVVLLGNGAR